MGRPDGRLDRRDSIFPRRGLLRRKLPRVRRTAGGGAPARSAAGPRDRRDPSRGGAAGAHPVQGLLSSLARRHVQESAGGTALFREGHRALFSAGHAGRDPADGQSLRNAGDPGGVRLRRQKVDRRHDDPVRNGPRRRARPGPAVQLDPQLRRRQAVPHWAAGVSDALLPRLAARGLPERRGATA